MNKNRFLIAGALILAGVYAFYFTDWFTPKTLQVFHTYRNLQSRPPREGTLPALIFGLNRSSRITEIKLVSLSAYQTNSNVLPLWHLVSRSNSVPVKTFFYGQKIRGLQPEVPGSRAQPLAPAVNYRLFVTAGNIKGEHDFALQ